MKFHEPEGALKATGGGSRKEVEDVLVSGETNAGRGEEGREGHNATASRERLEDLRDEIQEVDRELVQLLARRVSLARAVGIVKRDLRMPALDPAREAAVVRHAGAMAREAGVRDEEVRHIFWHLIGLARRAQLEEE